MDLLLLNQCQRLWLRLRKRLHTGCNSTFYHPSSQNVIERIENKDYISPNNNTDIRERVRFEIQLNKPYSLRDGFLRLYIKMVSLLALPIDVTSLEKAGRTVLVNLFKETLIKEIKYTRMVHLT